LYHVPLHLVDSAVCLSGAKTPTREGRLSELGIMLGRCTGGGSPVGKAFQPGSQSATAANPSIIGDPQRPDVPRAVRTATPERPDLGPFVDTLRLFRAHVPRASPQRPSPTRAMASDRLQRCRRCVVRCHRPP